MTDEFGPDHADENGSDPPTSFIKTNEFVIVGQALPAREGVKADGQAMQPFKDLRSDLGIAEGALGEFGGPATGVSSGFFVEASTSATTQASPKLECTHALG